MNEVDKRGAIRNDEERTAEKEHCDDLNGHSVVEGG